MPSADVSRALTADRAALGAILLSVIEDQWFERKSARIEARKLAEAMVGFANADGGVLVVGLSEGRVEGTRQRAAQVNGLMQAAIDFTQPPVRAGARLYPCRASTGEDDDLLVFDIPPAGMVHATTRDEVFLRVGDETRRLTFSQRRELLYEKGQAAFEAEPSPLSIEDVDSTLLSDYATRVGAPDAARLLRARGLADGDQLTMAGCLLFAAHHSQVMPNAHIRVSRFRGTERGVGSRQNVVGDERLEGPIPRTILAARARITDWQPTRRALGRAGTFEGIPLVPEDAWLEGVVNAAVHRSYSMGGDHVHVDIFDDRIEIESPGRFPGLVDVDDPLRVTRFARNPRIARVCADLALGQEFGEGIRRMFEEMRIAGLSDPLYHQTAGSVRLTLSGEPVDRVLDARLPMATRTIVAALRQSGQLSTGEISELIGAARPTTIRQLQELRAAGLMEWVGKSPRDPQARWRLNGGGARSEYGRAVPSAARSLKRTISKYPDNAPKQIRKQKMIKVVVLVGAGGSTALGAEPLPMMHEWADSLRSDLGDELAAALGLTEGITGEECEVKLGLFIEFNQNIDRYKSLVGVVDNSQVAGEGANWINQTVAPRNRIVQILRNNLYRNFSVGRLDETAAKQAYSGLTRLLTAADKNARICFATTNYDAAIEVGVSHQGRSIVDGFDQQLYGPSPYEPRLLAGEQIERDDVFTILHLHGAIGWYLKDEQVVRYGTNEYLPTAGVPVVLYPDDHKRADSLTGTPAIWTAFRGALAGATHLLTVGHSLNDNHINEFISEYLPESARVAVTTYPTESEQVQKKYSIRLKRRVSIYPLEFGAELVGDIDGLTRFFADE